jgi:hypothetical protein
MSDLPAALAQTPGELASAIMDRHGGRSNLTVVDFEVVAAMIRVFNAMRGAEPAELPRLVDSLAKLEQMLPSVAGRSPLDQLNAHINSAHGGVS